MALPQSPADELASDVPRPTGAESPATPLNASGEGTAPHNSGQDSLPTSGNAFEINGALQRIPEEPVARFTRSNSCTDGSIPKDPPQDPSHNPSLSPVSSDASAEGTAPRDSGQDSLPTSGNTFEVDGPPADVNDALQTRAATRAVYGSGRPMTVEGRFQKRPYPCRAMKTYIARRFGYGYGTAVYGRTRSRKAVSRLQDHVYYMPTSGAYEYVA
ncbi:hypothetical protein JOM56_013221 [Amanita muscaria]